MVTLGYLLMLPCCSPLPLSVCRLRAERERQRVKERSVSLHLHLHHERLFFFHVLLENEITGSYTAYAIAYQAPNDRQFYHRLCGHIPWCRCSVKCLTKIC
jgi:hypothetical protein